MLGRFRYLTVIVYSFFPAALPAADQWVKLTTPNFELYTTAGEKKGREAILYFEQVRSFFLEASASKRASEFPVRIVAFRGEKQYQPYRISEAAFAYFIQGRNRDYIVMQDIVSDHYPAAIHEYTHLIIEHAGLKPPPWLNEGLAELYSTLKPVGKKAAVGDIIPGRAQTLLTNKWISLATLTSADRQSPLYNEKDRAGMFYAESWALTHMLFFSPDYRPNFPKFLVAASSGSSMDEACQSTFHKHLQDVETDLRHYLKGERFYRAMFDIKLEKSAEEPEVSDASAFESGMVLADLMALARRTPEALSAYQELAKNNPDQPDVEESLGYLAWQSGDTAAAREHFSRAFDHGTKNAHMCFDYAMLSRSTADAVVTAVPAFQKALELKPDYVEARVQLGLMLVNTRKYPDAIAQLSQIKKIDPEQAQWYFPALAFSYLQTGDKAKARENAELAKKWAKTAQQLDHATALLESLDSTANRGVPSRKARATADAGDQRPRIQREESREFTVIEQGSPANPFVAKSDQMNHVEGTAQRFECLGRSARLHVLVGKTATVFEIEDPSRVKITHTGETTHDFACGAQRGYKISVDYAASDDKKGIAGIVRALEF